MKMNAGKIETQLLGKGSDQFTSTDKTSPKLITLFILEELSAQMTALKQMWNEGLTSPKEILHNLKPIWNSKDISK